MSRGRTRNDNCPCGSGKKFKHCHGRQKPARSAIPFVVVSLLVLGLIALIVLLPMTSSGGEARSSSPRVTHYGEIPGLDLTELGPNERLRFVNHLNHTDCVCGCDMTAAECRNIDPGCEHSEGMSQELLAQTLQSRVEGPVSSH